MTIDQIKAMNKPIALIGMMGVGKTHVGKVLAKRLGYEFIDTDQTIEQDQGRFITQIFAQQGEAAFRQMELAAITKALQAPNTVIATGGGCIKTPAIRKAFAQSALTCWLQATPEQIFNRIKDDTTRPLLQTENPLQTLKDLLSERQPYYSAAHIHVTTESKNADMVADDIINRLSTLPNIDRN